MGGIVLREPLSTPGAKNNFIFFLQKLKNAKFDFKSLMATPGSSASKN